jgi:hypothetical protein
MSKRTFRIREGEPLQDVVSYGRGGSRESSGRLTPAQVERIRWTVGPTPEAVVKVLARASNDLKAVGKHLDNIGRNGELELETDDGDRLSNRIGKTLLDDWDLDIDDMRRPQPRRVKSCRSPSIGPRSARSPGRIAGRWITAGQAAIGSSPRVTPIRPRYVLGLLIQIPCTLIGL